MKPLCARGVSHVALFGSYALRDARPTTSNIDMTVEVDPAAHITVFSYAGLKAYIASLFDGPIDVVSRGGLKPYVRPTLIADAVYAFCRRDCAARLGDPAYLECYGFPSHGGAYGMNIASAKVDELARCLAGLTGEDVETAVKRAIAERLSRIADPVPADRPAALRKFFDRVSLMPVRDSRSIDEIIDYGSDGLPSRWFWTPQR